MTAGHSTSNSPTPTGWEGILDEGETVLWQGRPDPRVVFRIEKAFQFIFGLFFAGFALFWMVMASQAGGVFWMFGLIHFSAGIAISFGAIFWDAYRRRHTWYTLTDRRAFIATDMPLRGRKLQSYPIDGATPLEFSPGPLATITFASEVRRGNKGRRYSVPVGFERIADGDAVYRHLRKIQEARSDAK
ncbi:aspartate carbamoyltransferase catalytic subunit [Aliiroseovarius sp.]|uniref:aspartate carbamoyltransferase catalytic subunit n=1 Tax=Aliiroseovarius sp. TaxID=1872442 RepID=UPI003BAC1A25